MRCSTSLLAFLGFVAVSVSAVPLSDISHTSVDVNAARQSLKSDSPRFTLTVHRTDDLVDEKAGTFVAERQVEIQMNFDIASTGDDNSLLLNGVPVKAGISHVEVKVKDGIMINRDMVTAPDGTVSEEMKEGVKSAFDNGLVTVEVSVHACTINAHLGALPPVPIRRFSLVVTVIEINGQTVVQTDIGEKDFFFGPGGEFVAIVENGQWAAMTQDEESSTLASQSVQPPSMKCRVARIRSAYSLWFERLPFALKFLIGFAWTAIGVAWGIFLASRLALLIRKYRNRNDTEKGAERYSNEKLKEMKLEVKSFGEGPPRYGLTVNEDKAPGEGDTENDKLCK